MAVAPQNFKRREQKYQLAHKQAVEIQNALSTSPISASPQTYVVTSVYLDTDNLSLISRSLEKPLYKEKLRIRAYGTKLGDALIYACAHGLVETEKRFGRFVLNEPVYFELKKKFKGIVYKRRIQLSLGAAIAFSQGATFSLAVNTWPVRQNPSSQCSELTDEDIAHLEYESNQISKEIASCIKRSGSLLPSIAIRCERLIYGSDAPCDTVLNNPANELRATFDTGLSYINLREKLILNGNSEPAFAPLINSQDAILEVKSATSMPKFLSEILTNLKVFPTSFSKYGTAAKLEKQLLYQTTQQQEAKRA